MSCLPVKSSLEIIGIVFSLVTIYMGAGMFCFARRLWINGEIRLIQEMPNT